MSVTGIPVSSASSRSRPRSSDPAPAIMIPRSTISAASSGGVRSSAIFTAATIPAIGSAIAARISVPVIGTARGNPDTRSRPRTAVICSSRCGHAEPTAILMLSAVRSPISRLYALRAY